LASRLAAAEDDRVRVLQAEGEAGSDLIVGIYRRRNAAHVRRLIEPALAAGWQSAWWALDQTDPSLADITVGEGPGLKLPLLNETLDRFGRAATWTVVSDDDVRFTRGDVVRFVRRADRAGFDLAQPARARGTELSHGITVAPRFSRARETTFVESGPLWAVGPRLRDRVLPFPPERGMGWGVEIDWYDLRAEGCRLGVVDDAQVEHLGERAEAYDDREIRRRLLDELEAHGHPRWAGMRETLAVWRPWQRMPPWSHA
jgi:hypothetical protein